MSQAPHHIPVLLREALDLLDPKAGETVLDVTLGLGGHARAFLERTEPNGRLIGLDADVENLTFATERLRTYSDRTEFHHENFGDLAKLSLPPIDILFADLGLSSPHVDDADRGFSFRFDGPLDLRYDRSTGIPACALIENASTASLAQIFREYGELFREAKKLGSLLGGRKFPTTTALKAAIEQGFGWRAPKILPQIFQALRLAVNDELGVLARLLTIGPTLLALGGRMGVISYHSLDDRMVKRMFRALTTPTKDLVTGKVVVAASFEEITHKAVVPTSAETTENPRSRSAKFRIIRRVR